MVIVQDQKTRLSVNLQVWIYQRTPKASNLECYFCVDASKDRLWSTMQHYHYDNKQERKDISHVGAYPQILGSGCTGAFSHWSSLGKCASGRPGDTF